MFKRKLLSMVLLAGMLLGQSVPHAYATTFCDQAQFVSDITVPDGASFAPGTSFTKTWRFTNTGTCTWTTSYKLVFVGGDVMGTMVSVPVPVDVPPGQMLDISVDLTAPATPGHYKGLWKFSNEAGAQFGIGDSGTNAFWTDINVIATDAIIYDFVANAPYAQWRSGAGTFPYPGIDGDRRGFAYQVDRPHLEDDSFDSLPGLLTVPQNKYNGYIQAVYPEIEIRQSDKLQTLVNCEFGATGCYVTFRIDYLLPNGLQKKFWQWKEAPDKRFYRANLDLSSLAGQRVRFIFMLLSSGYASGDRAIWGSPRIVRTGTTQPPAPPATLTPLPPLTPTPTPIIPPPPPVIPSGCDRAIFGTDVNVPDGTIFSPGAAFSKTWRLKNSGNCTWTRDYKITYYSGEVMNAQTAVNMPYYVYPGGTVDITVNMIAPNNPGSYRGFWILSNANGTLFGIGSDASKPFWVEITVAGNSPQENGYDFWLNACAAQWKSGAGPLPCPGIDGDRKGFVLADSFSRLEDGTMGPAPSLLLSPEYKYNGYIQGYYPALTVQPGDRFRSVVGCDFGANCYVTFRLDYMTPNGGIFNFWQWRERNNKSNSTIDVDLTPLAGRSIRFILTILATGSATGDRARWGAPMIIRANQAAPATSTPLPPPTLTPLPPPTNTPNGNPGTIVTDPLIRKLYMSDASNGWATADYYILRTGDGGRTWYNVLPGITPSGAFFSSSMTGWVLTDTSAIFRTVDGGYNWIKYDVPFNNGTVQFIDGNNGFVMSVLGAATSKQSIAVYQTVDGGATWTRKFTNDPLIEGYTNSIPLGGHKNGMTFRDTTTGWVGGDIPVNGYFYLYKTTDSGVTWSQQPLSLPAGYESAYITITAPKFFGTNDAVLPVWMTLGAGMRDLYLYVSHDGGNTWMASSSFARNAEHTDIISMNNTISWDWTNIFHVTSNSGNNWNTLSPNINFGDAFRELDFVSPSTGWLIQSPINGSTPLYQTSDGGSTWTQISGNQSAPPTPVPPTSTPVTLIGPYAVIRVAQNDVLNIRQLAGASYPVVGSFPSDAINVMRTGPIAGELDGTEWMEVQNPSGGTGWVNAFYLTEYVSHDAFCADTRIAPLIEKLKLSMNQSDGLLLSQQVSLAHGMNVHLWAYQQPVHYTPEQAVGAFISTDIYNWGSGPSGMPDIGTFKEIIQPRMLDTLNASNMETYCDSLDKVYPLFKPWPYPGIRYYNLYKPATTSIELDYRTWLIGIEYYKGEPYIYSMVNIVWEP